MVVLLGYVLTALRTGLPPGPNPPRCHCWRWASPVWAWCCARAGPETPSLRGRSVAQTDDPHCQIANSPERCLDERRPDRTTIMGVTMFSTFRTTAIGAAAL